MSDQENQILGLSLLVQLSRRVREAGKAEEIGFIAVNDSKQLIDYRQSALFLDGKGVFSVSGLPTPDPGAPYVQWLKAVFKVWHKVEAVRKAGPEDLPRRLADTWQDWLPAHALIVPLALPGSPPLGILLLAREREWEDQELALLAELCSIYAQGFRALNPGKGLGLFAHRRPGKTMRIIAPALIVTALLFLPVRLSVQAPAEVAPKNPFVVRSPLDGVIDYFRIRPNENVVEGQVLFEFDRTNLKSRMGVASKSYEVAAEEYRQTAQMAVSDEKVRSEMEPRRGRMQEKAAELSYSRQLLARVEVKAPRPGIAVFADQNDWVGKNVSIGERVLVIADPTMVEMLIHLPVADAIELSPGTEVILYLTADPQRPRKGKLTYASYKPEVTPAGFVAYRLKADFIPDNEPLPRVGLTGSATIYSSRVSLAYLIFRRPLTVVRQWTGL